MRQFIFGTILILSSCTAKKEGVEENKRDKDTVAVTQSNSVIIEPKKEAGKIDFPLDS